MGAIAIPRLIPGTTLAVAEADYCYGTGTALLIMQCLPVDPRLLSSMEWVRLDCLRLRDDGSVLGAVSPLVRIRALAAAVRPVGWLPSLPLAAPERGVLAPATQPHEQRCPGGEQRHG